MFPKTSRKITAVFRDLPLIPEMLKRGELVYIALDGPGGSYLYQAYDWNVVPQDELSLYDSGDAEVVLVTCVPALIYDHRLLVTARLVGFKPAT